YIAGYLRRFETIGLLGYSYLEPDFVKMVGFVGVLSISYGRKGRDIDFNGFCVYTKAISI
ncbi:MAG: hypothetical protein R6V50_04750, partial [Thermoplasmatota archaeon]